MLQEKQSLKKGTGQELVFSMTKVLMEHYLQHCTLLGITKEEKGEVESFFNQVQYFSVLRKIRKETQKKA